MLKPPATQDFQTTISCPTLTNHGTKAAMNQLLADQWENREGRKIRGGGIAMKKMRVRKGDKERRWWE